MRYAGRFLQLERQSGLAPARSTVVVFEDATGTLEIHYRGRSMRWTEIVAPRLTPAAIPSPPHGTTTAAAVVRNPSVTPSKAHPWRRSIKEAVRPIWQVSDR